MQSGGGERITRENCRDFRNRERKEEKKGKSSGVPKNGPRGGLGFCGRDKGLEEETYLMETEKGREREQCFSFLFPFVFLLAMWF